MDVDLNDPNVCTLDARGDIPCNLKRSDLLETRAIGPLAILSSTGRMAIRYVLLKELDRHGPLNAQVGNRVANIITDMFPPALIPIDVQHLIGILKNPTWSDADGFPCRLVIQHPCHWSADDVIGCFNGLITSMACLPNLERKLQATVNVPPSCFPSGSRVNWRGILSMNQSFRLLNLGYAIRKSSDKRKRIKHKELRLLRNKLTAEQVQCNDQTWEIFYFIRWLFAHLHEDKSQTSKRRAFVLIHEIYVAVRALFPAFIPEFIYGYLKQGSGHGITIEMFDTVVF